MKVITQIISAILILFVLSACEPEMNREELLFQVDTYVKQFKERPINQSQYSLWFENGSSDNYVEKLLLFDSSTAEVLLFTHESESFSKQFENIIFEEPTISYAEAQTQLRVVSFKVDSELCPLIKPFVERLNKAKSLDMPPPPFYVLSGEATVSYYSGEFTFKQDVDFASLSTITSSIRDQPVIEELMLLLTTVERCLSEQGNSRVKLNN